MQKINRNSEFQTESGELIKKFSERRFDLLKSDTISLTNENGKNKYEIVDKFFDIEDDGDTEVFIVKLRDERKVITNG